MADLHVLRRSDSDLLLIHAGSTPKQLAKKLAEGHAFEVSVALTLRGFGHLTLCQSNAPGHIRNGWLQATLEEVVAWFRQEVDANISRQLTEQNYAGEQNRGADDLIASEGDVSVVELDMSPSEEEKEFENSSASQRPEEDLAASGATRSAVSANEVDLTNLVCECRPQEADKATVVRKHLEGAIGLEDTNLFLGSYRCSSIRSCEKEYRRVYVHLKDRTKSIRLVKP